MDDRMLGGIYNFKIIDAISYEPIKDMRGQYTVAAKENGDWTSNDDGNVYLDNLKTGLTNIQITSDPTYFNHVINGAKVFKPSHKNNMPGRAILAVPRDIENTLVLTLTWLGTEYNLSIIAESTTRSVD